MLHSDADEPGVSSQDYASIFLPKSDTTLRYVLYRVYQVHLADKQ